MPWIIWIQQKCQNLLSKKPADDHSREHGDKAYNQSLSELLKVFEKGHFGIAAHGFFPTGAWSVNWGGGSAVSEGGASGVSSFPSMLSLMD